MFLGPLDQHLVLAVYLDGLPLFQNFLLSMGNIKDSQLCYYHLEESNFVLTTVSHFNIVDGYIK